MKVTTGIKAGDVDVKQTAVAVNVALKAHDVAQVAASENIAVVITGSFNKH
jgi:threonine synthase